MKVAYIRWKDACQEAAEEHDVHPEPTLCELIEVGFLLAETPDVVLIGMEAERPGYAPGRWRLHIPRNAIIEMRVIDVKAIRTRVDHLA